MDNLPKHTMFGTCEQCENDVTLRRAQKTSKDGSIGPAGDATYTRYFYICPRCGAEQVQGEVVIE